MTLKRVRPLLLCAVLSGAVVAPGVVLAQQTTPSSASDANVATTAKDQDAALKNEEKANKQRAKAAKEQRKALRAQEKAAKASKKAGDAQPEVKTPPQ